MLEGKADQANNIKTAAKYGKTIPREATKKGGGKYR